MNIHRPFQITKCSKCGSTDYEHVTHNHKKFFRCLQCGHESERKPIGRENPWGDVCEEATIYRATTTTKEFDTKEF